MTLTEILKERNLPPLKSKEEMLRILLDEEYGTMPPLPDDITFTREEILANFCAGHATLGKVTARGTINGKEFSFPFYEALPTDGKKHPFFIHINFRPEVPDRYMPTEELIDKGYAVLSFCYKDVTSDDGDFTNGLAGILFENGKRGSRDCGKIAMWAWASHRLMDYAETLTNHLDISRATVCGHSRLGKTALLAAATDSRFAFSYSNDSGCSGASLARGTTGETVKQICERFPFWFCEEYLKYCDNEEAMPFDQHYLIASVAPAKAIIGSASRDAWADPLAEQLGCLGASGAFEKGFVAPDRKALTGEAFFEGDIGYHLREGTHYFSRHDWIRLIEYIEMH